MSSTTNTLGVSLLINPATLCTQGPKAGRKMYQIKNWQYDVFKVKRSISKVTKVHTPLRGSLSWSYCLRFVRVTPGTKWIRTPHGHRTWKHKSSTIRGPTTTTPTPVGPEGGRTSSQTLQLLLVSRTIRSGFRSFSVVFTRLLFQSWRSNPEQSHVYQFYKETNKIDKYINFSSGIKTRSREYYNS